MISATARKDHMSKGVDDDDDGEEEDEFVS